MKEFLMDRARELHADMFLDDAYHYPPNVHYHEDISPDAIEGDRWLETDASYIWRVGVLALTDANKCDWAYLFIGHQRAPGNDPEFIGHLYWRDGENDDIGRCLRRYVEIASILHPVFDAS